jgi:hypothetical protein
MKHPSVRELYEYWNARRGLCSAPDRAEIEPGAIRRVLADTFIIAFDPRAGHPFRIAGTRVCAAFGRELKGVPFVEVWDRDSQKLVRDLLTIVAHESVGIVAGARGICAEGSGPEGSGAEGSALQFELLVLPLRHRARTDARVLGALAPAEVPYWFGVSTLERLSIGTIRYLSTDSSVRPQPALVATEATGRIRHGFTIYDGGAG